MGDRYLGRCASFVVDPRQEKARRQRVAPRMKVSAEADRKGMLAKHGRCYPVCSDASKRKGLRALSRRPGDDGDGAGGLKRSS